MVMMRYTTPTMVHEDLGMKVIGAAVKPEMRDALGAGPATLGLDYEIEWDDGIPHCACCGRYCRYADALHTDLDRLQVVSMPGIPVSEAMCPECLASGAVPYGLLVAQAACVTDSARSFDEQWAPWFQELVRVTLDHHGVTRDQFNADVRRDIEALDAYCPEEGP